MHTVGQRTPEGASWEDQAPLARTAALLRGTPWLVPRGIYRFKSFDEADTWMTETILRTHAHLSRQMSSGSVER